MYNARSGEKKRALSKIKERAKADRKEKSIREEEARITQKSIKIQPFQKVRKEYGKQNSKEIHKMNDSAKMKKMKIR